MNVLYFRFANSLLETSEQDVWAAMNQLLNANWYFEAPDCVKKCSAGTSQRC